MKITGNDKVNVSKDIYNLILDFQSKYKTVYWIMLDGEIYIYKPIGRRDYKEVCENQDLSDLDKEDELIRRSLLYPDPNTFDVDDLVAGVAKNLFETILQNSFLTSIEVRTNLLSYFRSEMYDVQNQITCLINEAFPNYDIEDIENWGIEKTAKFLSRAEWKLQNLRGCVMNYDIANSQQMQQPEQQQMQNVQEEKIQNTENKMKDNNSSISGTSKKRERLTPEKLAELQRNFPGIDWAHDTIMEEGEEGMKDHVDIQAPALRTPDMKKNR